tara:strand:+ start:769 stop:1149 length:381 start_codon:yes stop_codon:yes gene_type:complete
MDCLSREQLLLLQQNLTYEVYEEFMGMFDKDEERIPDDGEEAYRFILDVLKRHEYFGQISGWGDEAIYVNIPSDFNLSILKTHIYDAQVETHKELVEYLDSYPHKDRLNLELQDKKNSCLRVKDSV